MADSPEEFWDAMADSERQAEWLKARAEMVKQRAKANGRKMG
jgi:hypothetical protein